MTKLIRVLAATALLPGAVLAAAGVLANAWRDRLPDPVATHWNGVWDGAPNGSSPLGTSVVVCLVFGGFLTLFTTAHGVIALHRRRPLPRLAVGLGAGFAVMPPAVLLSMLVPNLDAPDWQAARGASAVAVFLPGVVVLGISAAYLGGLPTPVREPAADRPSVGLRPGQRAFWTGRAESPGRLWTLAVIPLAAGSVPLGFPWPAAAAAVVVTVLVTALTYRVTVTVDASGVTIRLGFLGVPRRHFGLDAIHEASARELTTFGDGGLGIRVNVATGTTAYKARGGPALVLSLETGRTVLVSVDDPDTGAGLVNDLIAQRITRIG